MFGFNLGGKYLDRHLSQACQGNGNGFSVQRMKNHSRSVVRKVTNRPPTHHFRPDNPSELTPMKLRPLTREEVREVDRIAIDVPTGLDCDTGIAADPTFIATATLTFVAPKIGFSQPSAAQFLGRVVPISIGLPKKLLEQIQAVI